MSKPERFTLLHIFLSMITFGLYVVVRAIIASRTTDPELKRGDRVKCRKCGSRYIFES